MYRRTGIVPWKGNQGIDRCSIDSRNNFSYLYHNDIVPDIKVRKNSSFKSGVCYPRKVSVISQLTCYQYWKDSVSYGKRWVCHLYSSGIDCNYELVVAKIGIYLDIQSIDSLVDYGIIGYVWYGITVCPKKAFCLTVW